MNELITVIVPVYNVQPYLEKCVSSIVNQTYKFIEIILVDDGSTDESGKTCNELALKDDRIVVIHQKNGGLSDARNTGLDNATGKYVTFIDSDDYIHHYMLEKMIMNVKKNELNVIISNYQEFRIEDIVVNKKDYSVKESQGQNLTSSDMYEDIFDINKHTLYTVAWGKLYDKSLFDKVRFPKGKIHEDEFTTYKLLHQATNISFIDEPFYYYLKRDDSIMGSKFDVKRLVLLDAFQERLTFYQKNKEDRKWINTFIGLKSMILRNMKNLDESSEYSISYMNKYLKYYKSEYKSYCKNLEFNKTEKMKCRMFSICPRIYYQYFKHQMKKYE